MFLTLSLRSILWMRFHFFHNIHRFHSDIHAFNRVKIGQGMICYARCVYPFPRTLGLLIEDAVFKFGLKKSHEKFSASDCERKWVDKTPPSQPKKSLIDGNVPWISRGPERARKGVCWKGGWSSPKEVCKTRNAWIHVIGWRAEFQKIPLLSTSCCGIDRYRIFHHFFERSALMIMVSTKWARIGASLPRSAAKHRKSQLNYSKRDSSAY